MFRFKQFNVDQSGCAMKINTDGVLLGAIAYTDKPKTVLDIGAGTGVIALMLAQKFNTAKVDAVEIDADAAQTADRNFKGSPFAERLMLFALGFEVYFDQFPEKKYDLIVSNPPFYVDSLKSPGVKKALAKHTDNDFFERLINVVSCHLTADGYFWLIIPVTLADMIVNLAADKKVFPHDIISVQSYPHSEAHRVIIKFGFNKVSVQTSILVIYEAVGVYSETYKNLLQPYFLAF